MDVLPVCPPLYVLGSPSLCLTTEEPSFYCSTSSMSSPKRASFCCRNLGQLYRNRRKALNKNKQHMITAMMCDSFKYLLQDQKEVNVKLLLATFWPHSYVS